MAKWYATEGFLNNPYRSVRFIDATAGLGYSFQPEIYPETKTSTAAALSGNYYLTPTRDKKFIN